MPIARLLQRWEQINLPHAVTAPFLGQPDDIAVLVASIRGAPSGRPQGLSPRR
jgi:hypothetical protein